MTPKHDSPVIEVQPPMPAAPQPITNDQPQIADLRLNRSNRYGISAAYGATVFGSKR